MYLLNATYFTHQKSGELIDENEDAFSCHLENGSFAIADGAATSSYSRQWAQSLTKDFVHNHGYTLIPKDSRDQHRIFADWLSVQHVNFSGFMNKIDWDVFLPVTYEKALAGQFATFLGLILNANTSLKCEWRWRAFAVGDCELFQVRNNRLISWFPIGKSIEFDNPPDLICHRLTTDEVTLRKINEYNVQKLKITGGKWQPDDHFILCTDTLACWFLSQTEKRGKPWSILFKINSQEDFNVFVSELRSSEAVKNDDMTLAIITIGGGQDAMARSC